jgi:hypothetical protein
MKRNQDYCPGRFPPPYGTSLDRLSQPAESKSNMPSNQTQNASAAPGGIERRKYSRHRFIVDLNISSESGATMHGMSFEIGAGGMSAATAGQLEVGEQVLLYPVLRPRVKATVRRKNGSMYGFEFVAPNG